VFVDPISDIAVLTSPDNQAASAQADAYASLTNSAALSVTEVAQEGSSPAWLLSLEGHWFRCTIGRVGPNLWISNAAQGIVGGMSGSPILADDGSALGVLSCSGGSGDVHTDGGPEPALIQTLPQWLVAELTRAE